MSQMVFELPARNSNTTIVADEDRWLLTDHISVFAPSPGQPMNSQNFSTVPKSIDSIFVFKS